MILTLLDSTFVTSEAASMLLYFCLEIIKGVHTTLKFQSL